MSVADEEIVHQIEPKARTSMLPPVMVIIHQTLPPSQSPLRYIPNKILTQRNQSKQIDDHPLSWLGFVEGSIITACSNG